MKPKILFTDTNRWPVPARLAVSFSRLGSRVAALCPQPGHPIRAVAAVERFFPYSGFHPAASLRYAIEQFDPDFVIASCDRGVGHLHGLHASVRRDGTAGEKIAALIERSLGPADSFSVVSSRYELMCAARSEGICVPLTIAVSHRDDLGRCGAEMPLPWVLKADGTWGGRGVRVVHTLKAAEEAFADLTRRPGAFELAKRLTLNRDRGWIVASWRQPAPAVIGQSLINGRPANCAVVCWQGKVLAGIGVEVVRAQGEKGPATVVEVIDSQAMMQAAERIAARLKLSGFFGLDFMIEDRTETVYLIEMNPRCTPPSPLALGKGRDLAAAMWAQLTGEPLGEIKAMTSKTRIAYFPHCYNNAVEVGDTNLAETSYDDIPSGEPKLVRELLYPWSERSLLGQMIDHARRTSAGKKSVAAHTA